MSLKSQQSSFDSMQNDVCRQINHAVHVLCLHRSLLHVPSSSVLVYLLLDVGTSIHRCQFCPVCCHRLSNFKTSFPFILSTYHNFFQFLGIQLDMPKFCWPNKRIFVCCRCDLQRIRISYRILFRLQCEFFCP